MEEELGSGSAITYGGGDKSCGWFCGCGAVAGDSIAAVSISCCGARITAGADEMGGARGCLSQAGEGRGGGGARQLGSGVATRRRLPCRGSKRLKRLCDPRHRIGSLRLVWARSASASASAERKRGCGATHLRSARPERSRSIAADGVKRKGVGGGGGGSLVGAAAAASAAAASPSPAGCAALGRCESAARIDPMRRSADSGTPQAWRGAALRAHTHLLPSSGQERDTSSSTETAPEAATASDSYCANNGLDICRPLRSRWVSTSLSDPWRSTCERHGRS
ncbi:spidroin-1-like [Schistocerca gregaria]|uniref:spidroin-1-like n=1 Tax=Schistocerca gregaria TaxID=7010 RepID=UPI00211EF0B9|nr:spidroin-1-like [Schistocerca gregaria]